jgi:hypothetical protein
MSDFDYADMLRTLFPKGPIWAFRAFGDADKLIDAIGEVKDTIRGYLKSLAHVRNPSLTPILSDLEREYGITPVASLTEAERRTILAGYVYAKAGNSSKDDLEARLHAAGFTDLFVYHNDPIVNPNFYTASEWAAVCGHEDTVCGNQSCYCGQLGIGGYVLANGKVFEASGAEHEYVLPPGSETWPMVFFVGGAKVATSTGFVVFVDGDMEEETTVHWTAGNGAALTKSTTEVHEGDQSLAVSDPEAGSFATQDVNLDERYAVDAFLMYDSGDGVIRSLVLAVEV